MGVFKHLICADKDARDHRQEKTDRGCAHTHKQDRTVARGVPLKKESPRNGLPRRSLTCTMPITLGPASQPMSDDIPTNAKKYYDEAVTILQEDIAHRRTLRGTDQVIANLGKAVEEHQKYFEAWRLMGEVYMGTEQTLLGYLALKRAHKLKEDDVGAAVLLGEGALVLGRPKLALEFLKTALEAEEVPLAAHKLKALALAGVEEWEQSLRAFGEALAGDPSDGGMRRECSKVLSELGYRKEAASVLADYLDPFRDFIDNQQVILDTSWMMPYGSVLDRLAPGSRKRTKGHEVIARAEDYRAWYSLGNVFLDGEQHEAAAVCFKRALRIHPDYSDALHNMGIALEEIGRREEALQLYEAAMEADPEAPEVYLSMAELLEEIEPEETDEIVINYLMYYRLDPDAEGFEEQENELREMLGPSPDVSQELLLAHVYLLRDEIAKAETILRTMEASTGDEATLLWLQGRILQEKGASQEAERAFRTGLEIAGDNDSEESLEEDDVEARLRYDLAALLADSDREEEAKVLLMEDRDLLDSDGLSLLADLLVDDNPQEAEKTWVQALDLDPEHCDSLTGLADLKISQKLLEDGIILLERALGTDPDDKEIPARLAELYPEIGAPELSPSKQEASEPLMENL